MRLIRKDPGVVLHSVRHESSLLVSSYGGCMKKCPCCGSAAVLRMAERHASHNTWLMTSEDRGEALSTCICPGHITQTAASAQATIIANAASIVYGCR